VTDNLASNGTDTLAETLGRLSKKAGVQATVVLDRNTGSIMKTTGHFSSSRASTAPMIPSQSPNTVPIALRVEDNSSSPGQTQGVEELALMTWNFVNAAGELVQGLDVEDEVKLLRLRTKNHELVIVPDAKYLLIVIHETPPA